MHTTIEGNYNTLAVRMYPMKIHDYEYLFFDNYDQYNNWVNKEIADGHWQIEQTKNYKDINYLLNDMIRSKETRWGEILYDIYCRHYPDSDQKVNVWKMWNGMKIVKGKEYFIRKKPWYSIVKSFISNITYNVTIKCKKCNGETEQKVTEITSECPKCKLTC